MAEMPGTTLFFSLYRNGHCVKLIYPQPNLEKAQEQQVVCEINAITLSLSLISIFITC